MTNSSSIRSQSICPKAKEKQIWKQTQAHEKDVFPVIAESEKYQLNEKLLPKASYQCTECGHKA